MCLFYPLATEDSSIIYPRNIALSQETSNFMFECKVTESKAVNRHKDEFIMKENKILKQYSEYYSSNGSKVTYLKKAEEYVNDTYHDCYNSLFYRYRAVFAVLCKSININ